MMNTYENFTSTTDRPAVGPGRDPHLALILTAVFVVLVVISVLLYWYIRRRRKLARMRQNLLVMYEFDANEQEWESLNSYDGSNYVFIRGYSSTDV